MRRVVSAVAAAVAAALLLAGCVPGSDRDDPDTLRILAGSEVKDMLPILETAASEIGVKVALDYAGTLDGTERVASGAASSSYDATWFPNNRYLSLLPGADKQIRSSTKIMTSPVVFGLRASVAKRLGWDATPPTWAEIAEAAGAGDFDYGMTNPAASNSGFSALVAVATALSGTGSAITESDIATVTPQMTDFFSAQKLTAGSSGWLADRFVDDPTKVDGIVNYESVLMGLHPKGGDLTIITPTDGVVTSDYPLTLLTSASDHKRELYQKLTTWLTSKKIQERIAADVHRRPAIPGIDTGSEFPKTVLFETPFPNTLATANSLISTYLETVRKPSQAVFALDTSGSMQGDRIERLRSALKDLAGADTSTVGAFSTFRARERITLLPFSSSPQAPVEFDLPEGNTAPTLKDIRREADGLDSGGGTAIYDTLEEAYRIAQDQREERPDTYVSVVLMTDGENTEGSNASDFRSWYSSRSASLADIPTFIVLFGDSDTDELTDIAKLTGGQTFDALNGDLAAAFREIRGYQ